MKLDTISALRVVASARSLALAAKAATTSPTGIRIGEVFTAPRVDGTRVTTDAAAIPQPDHFAARVRQSPTRIRSEPTKASAKGRNESGRRTRNSA
jgi:hypothetical protein